jgi:hypothetical protein
MEFCDFYPAARKSALKESLHFMEIRSPSPWHCTVLLFSSSLLLFVLIFRSLLEAAQERITFFCFLFLPAVQSHAIVTPWQVRNFKGRKSH